MPKMSSLHLKTKELLRFQSGMWLMPMGLRKLLTKYELNITQDKGVIKVLFSNKVAKAMRYVADAYSPKESPYKIWTQYDLRQRSY